MKRISVENTLELKCSYCSAQTIEIIPDFTKLRRITSDCQIWSHNGNLGICRTCSGIQKPADKAFLEEIDQVYNAYSIYHQGEGSEISIVDENSGQLMPRSEKLFRQFSSHIPLPEKGRMLDIGCGNGAFLRVFSRLAPGWFLVGSDLHDKYRDVVEAIDRVEKLYVCDPKHIPGNFNLISMIYVFEHIIDPKEYLIQISEKLADDGLILIEVPDYNQNPFDLLIVDHCNHFTATLMSKLLESAGFELISVATDWIPKGLTVVARKSKTQSHIALENGSYQQQADMLIKYVRWLNLVLSEGSRVAKIGNFGVFGTGIAATWLVNELGGEVKFFIDEDLNRAGSLYMDRPVYLPEDAPVDGNVYIALPYQIAANIKKRLEKTGYSFQCYLPIPRDYDVKG